MWLTTTARRTTPTRRLVRPLDPDSFRELAWSGPRVPEFFLVADWEPASSSQTADLAEAERALARYTEAEGASASPESHAKPGSARVPVFGGGGEKRP